MLQAIKAVGRVTSLSGRFVPDFVIDPDFYIQARLEDSRSHSMSCRVMTVDAVGKTLARLGRLADMILDSMRAASARIVLCSGA